MNLTDFKVFLDYFPEIELPVTLADESIHSFSQENKPLPEELIKTFIRPFLKEADDQYREIIPCFKIPDTHDFFALVFWDGSLQAYEYNLICYGKNGKFIDGKVIAGSSFDNKQISHSVSTIDTEWQINIVAGIQGIDEQSYEATRSKLFKLELMPDGQIIFFNE